MEKEHFEILLEDINGKVDLILEGYTALDRKIDSVYDRLNEKIEINSIKLEALNEKIDAVAVDLSAHRADTEAHRQVFSVREDG